MSNWDMCFYCKIKECSLAECPTRDKRKYELLVTKPELQAPANPADQDS